MSPVVNQVADDDDRQPIPEGKVTKRKSQNCGINHKNNNRALSGSH